MKWLSGLMAGLFLAAGAQAQTVAVSPDTLVKNVTNEVLDIVRKDKDIQSGNAKRAVSLVEAKVLPHFDFGRMTSLAVGKYWKQANPAQQKTLTDEFRALLVNTYSTALTQYRDQTIEFSPCTKAMQIDPPDVKVCTVIRQSGTAPKAINYTLEKLDGGWKVYDIDVAGIDLVTSYRSEFSQEVSQNGIDGLIKRLQAKNKK